jgi:hypothetical protein
MNIAPVQSMKPAPTASDATVERRTPSASPRPTAWPTMTAAADETPSGTMNVSDARFNAIWCAATCATPSQPIRSAMTLNAPPSSIICAPIGSPSFDMRRIGRRSSRFGAISRKYGFSVRQPSASISTAMSQRLTVVAHAEPSTPIGGKPRLP